MGKAGFRDTTGWSYLASPDARSQPEQVVKAPRPIKTEDRSGCFEEAGPDQSQYLKRSSSRRAPLTSHTCFQGRCQPTGQGGNDRRDSEQIPQMLTGGPEVNTGQRFAGLFQVDFARTAGIADDFDQPVHQQRTAWYDIGWQEPDCVGVFLPGLPRFAPDGDCQ